MTVPTSTISSLPPIASGKFSPLALLALDGSDGVTGNGSMAQLGLAITPQQFGAKGDGVNDDTAAIQAAITAASISPTAGGLVYLPPGNYKTTATITLNGLQGITIMGAGASATFFKPSGAIAFDLFRIWGSRDCSFIRFSVLSSPSSPLATAFTMETQTGFTITHITYRDLILNGGNAGGLDKGFKMIAGSGGDNNNDFHFFENVAINNYGSAGVSIEHAQSKVHTMISCIFSGNFAFSQRAITTALGAHGVGSFLAIACGGGSNNVADFDIGDADDYVIIIGGRWEHSARLLQTGGASGAAFPVELYGVNWSCDQTHLVANKQAVLYQFHGPFIMHGCSFGGDYVALTIAINNPSVGSAIVGNTFRSTAVDPLAGINLPVHRAANSIDRNDGNGVIALDVGMYNINGVPSNSNLGKNGDFAFRGDGTVGSNIYKKAGGVWTAIL